MSDVQRDTDARDLFVAQCFTQPLLRADAVVLLTGDGLTRVDTALALLRQQAAPTLLISGCVQAPPYAIDAAHLRREMIERGCPPSRLMDPETDSTNTRASLLNVCAIAKANQWRRILLVTSAYHVPRAMLSAVKACAETDMPDLHVLPVAVVQPWEQFIDLSEHDSTDRASLWYTEREKCATYQAQGDIATYDAGLDYFARWETRL